MARLRGHGCRAETTGQEPGDAPRSPAPTERAVCRPCPRRGAGPGGWCLRDNSLQSSCLTSGETEVWRWRRLAGVSAALGSLSCPRVHRAREARILTTWTPCLRNLREPSHSERHRATGSAGRLALTRSARPGRDAGLTARVWTPGVGPRSPGIRSRRSRLREPSPDPRGRGSSRAPSSASPEPSGLSQRLPASPHVGDPAFPRVGTRCARETVAGNSQADGKRPRLRHPRAPRGRLCRAAVCSLLLIGSLGHERQGPPFVGHGPEGRRAHG